MKIHKIVITGDFLRVDKNNGFSQEVNILWLYHLLLPILSLINKKISICPLLGSHTERGENIAEKFYIAQGSIPRIESWIRLSSDVNPRQQALLHSHLSNALVISFELPDIVSNALTDLDIPFIDFTIHPVRFMKDLIFGVRSNIVDIFHDFTPWRVFEENFHIEAGYAMARLVRLPRLPSCQDSDNIGLVACQTSYDKVLIKNRKIVTIEDFNSEVIETLQSHKKILVKPHPYENDNRTELFLMQLLPNTHIIKDNFYHILSHKNISTVYSISSSTSIEAKYFGKKGKHFIKYPYLFSDNMLNESTFLAIKPCFLQPKLWTKIFSRLDIPITQQKKLPTIDIDIRKSLNSYWGADILYK